MAAFHGFLPPWNRIRLQRAVERDRADCGSRAPVLEAALGGRINFAVARRPGLLDLGVMTRAGLPAIVVVLDLDGAGPEAWPGLPRMLRWAKRVLLFSGADPAAQYAEAAATVERCPKLLVVECSSTARAAWEAQCGPLAAEGVQGDCKPIRARVSARARGADQGEARAESP